MKDGRRSLLIRYGIAICIILTASVLARVLDDLFGMGGDSFIVVFAAAVLASLAGVGPSILALTLSLVIPMVFYPDTDPASDPPLVVIAGLGLYFFVGLTTGVLSDVLRAARRRAQGEAERLRTTLACIGDAVIVTDSHSRVTMMNAVAEALTGWKSAEAIGQRLDDIFSILNEFTREPVENPVATVLREGIIVGLANHSMLIAKDGSERPIDDSAAPIRDNQGNTVGVVLIFRDVTERRRNEKALRDADRRKDEFLAILAHELRNPLAPISMSLNILKTPGAGESTYDWAKEVMERQIQHLVRLVDDLLDVSRIMRGKIELRLEEVDLQNAVLRAVEAVKSLTDSKQQELMVSLPDEPLKLRTDPVRLAQIINNLLNNAAKYTEPKGRIWLTAEASGNEVIIRVRDSGIGISQEMLPRIFDLFTQVDSSTSRSQGGLGIGLTLVKNLVELNGGRITAHSDGPNHGSEFIVHLPRRAHLVAPEEPIEPAVREDNRVARPKYHILVVDDNVDAAATLTQLLQLHGHSVETVHNGPGAIRAAKSRLPDVVFLDIGMPLMDGYEVARKLRALPDGNSMLLVALTGWGQDEDRRRTSAAGFNAHLVKPVELGTIEELFLQKESSSMDSARLSPSYSKKGGPLNARADHS